MIFNRTELYLLGRPAPVRWGVTALLLALLAAVWYFYAFAPLRNKIAGLKATIAISQAAHETQHELQARAEGHDTACKRRLRGRGDVHHFLKDIHEAGLQIVKATTIKQESPATHLELDLAGKFDDFYHFLTMSQSRYLCAWNSCVCTQTDHLAIQAAVTLYHN